MKIIKNIVPTNSITLNEALLLVEKGNCIVVEVHPTNEVSILTPYSPRSGGDETAAFWRMGSKVSIIVPLQATQ